MVRLIDRRSTEERHDECFHQELEGDAARDAHGQVAGPTLGPNVSDVTPWRARPLDPQEHENGAEGRHGRSEEHTSELQSRLHLVCRLLLEKKKKNTDSQARCVTMR